MDNFAVIGGSGFYELHELEKVESHAIETPFGAPTTSLLEGVLNGKRCVFLPRHGPGHKIPPHKINYRANIKALHQLGVENIISVNAVGGIHPAAVPGALVVPDQVIDYTYGREHTFADVLSEHVNHIDFTDPFCQSLRERLQRAYTESGLEHGGTPLMVGGVYGCSQGPRLETAAEIRKMQRDGCDLVGMTAMPEAALARELGMQYASLCVVVNRAAGLEPEPISMAMIQQILCDSIASVRQVLLHAVC